MYLQTQVVRDPNKVEEHWSEQFENLILLGFEPSTDMSFTCYILAFD